MQGLSLVAASGGHSSSLCTGLSLSRPLLLWSTGSRRAGSVVVAHGPSCSAACGIFPDQGSNPCSLHWQADSQPLHHQGSPWLNIYIHYGMITIILVSNFPHTKLLQYCIPYSLCCILHPLAYLFYNWKLAPLNPLHLFHPTHHSTLLWQTPVCSLYQWSCSHFVLFFRFHI